MEYQLARSAPTVDPAGGLLLAEHFQMAYVTTDIDLACQLFSSRLGIRQFSRLEGPLKEGGYIRAELAWVGSIMYELIWATGPGSELYMDRLPSGPGFSLKHHHLGFLLRDRQQWDAMMEGAKGLGWPIPYCNDNSWVEVCFVDATGLGHYLEYFLPKQAGLDFFNSVPRQGSNGEESILSTASHEIVVKFFQALGAGSLSDDLFTADMSVWTVSSGTLDKTRFLGGARLLASLFNGTLAYTVDSVTAEGDRVAVEAQSRGTLANGESFHNTHMYLFRIRDGRIAGLSEYMNQTLIKEKIAPLMQAAMARRQI